MQDNLTIILYVAYYVCAVSWGIYAIIWKKEVYPESSLLKLVYIGWINQLFFPICIFLAIKRFKSDLNIIKRREYEKNNSIFTSKFILP